MLWTYYSSITTTLIYHSSSPQSCNHFTRSEIDQVHTFFIIRLRTLYIFIIHPSVFDDYCTSKSKSSIIRSAFFFYHGIGFRFVLTSFAFQGSDPVHPKAPWCCPRPGKPRAKPYDCEAYPGHGVDPQVPQPNRPRRVPQPFPSSPLTFQF